MGRIKIEGKTYDSEDDYDYCACRELAGKDEEHPEQLVKGTQIEVIKAGSYENPDYSQEDADEAAENNETYDVPEKLDWYVAVNTNDTSKYQGELTEDLMNNNSTVITIKDSDGTDVSLTIYGKLIQNGKKIRAGEWVKVQRTLSETGIILDVYLGACPKTV
jgi:hypothetical protein